MEELIESHLDEARGQKQKQKWMKQYAKLTGDPQPKPRGYWDTATHLFNQGVSPKDAAARFKKRTTESVVMDEATYSAAKPGRRSRGGTIRITKDKAGIWLNDEGPYARAADAAGALQKILRKRPKSIVLAKRFSLGPAGTADPYSQAPYAIYGYRGEVVATGFDPVEMMMGHVDKFLMRDGPLPRGESMESSFSLVEAVDRILSEGSYASGGFRISAKKWAAKMAMDLDAKVKVQLDNSARAGAGRSAEGGGDFFKATFTPKSKKGVDPRFLRGKPFWVSVEPFWNQRQSRQEFSVKVSGVSMVSSKQQVMTWPGSMKLVLAKAAEMIQSRQLETTPDPKQLAKLERMKKKKKRRNPGYDDVDLYSYNYT